MANKVTDWSDGDILTAAALEGEFENIYAGTIDRTAGRWGTQDAIPVTFGNSQDCSVQYSAVQTNDALIVGVGTDSRSIIVCDEGDKTTNFAYDAQTNPTLYIHSAAATANQYISITHNGTNGVITMGTGGILFSGAGKFFFNETADTDITVGLSVNQGANTDKILTLKQSSVAHGITTSGQFGVETDTYGAFSLWDTSGTVGGLLVSGYTGDKGGLCLAASYATGDTTKTTSADGAIHVIGQKKTGTTIGSMATDENILVIKDYQTPRFIFDCMGAMFIPAFDLGDGHEGPGIKIGRNTNSTNTGAGWLCLTDKAGTAYYLWVDATGDLRIDTSAPTNANDTGGDVVGDQTA